MLIKLLKVIRSLINKRFQPLILSLASFTLISYFGLFIWIFYFLPEEKLQGNLVKILYIHVPAAWISLGSYLVLGLLSLYYLIYQERFLSFCARAATLVALNSSLITLVTGAIWGKAAWGTWWVWDPRLTSLFIQFCLLSLVTLMRLSNNNYNSSLEQFAALISLLGVINLPIIKFSVEAWTSLHQEASIFRLDGVKIDSPFLIPLLVSFLAMTSFYLLLGALSIKRQLLNMKKLQKISSNFSASS
jgi:heme exporter protein C